MFTSIAGMLAKRALKLSLAAFCRASDQNVTKAIRLLKAIAPPNYRDALDKLWRMVETRHPGVVLIRNIGKNTHVKCQEKLIQNLIINQEFFGEKQRIKTKNREKVQIPSLIVISPTYACNLNCVGCYAGEYGNRYKLEKELVFDIVRQANALGIYFFTISGGEPFAWPHLFELLESFPDSYFLIYTNGTLLDDSVCERLAQLGNGSPAVSIEGFEKETDERRGAGMYDKISEAMRRLKQHGIFFGASVTHTTANHDAVVNDAFWSSLVENGASYAWIFQYIPIGLKPDLALMPSPQQRKERYEAVHRVRASMPILLADFWNDGHLVNGCMAGGAQYLHINAKGLVEPCVFQHFAVDDIRGKSLLEVLRSPYFKAIQRQIPYSENLLAPCMIIDHPELMKEAVEKYGAAETHEGAATIIREFHDYLRRYASEWRGLSQEIWSRDFGDKKVIEKGFFTYREDEPSDHAHNQEVQAKKAL